jgi:hypothetical protein
VEERLDGAIVDQGRGGKRRVAAVEQVEAGGGALELVDRGAGDGAEGGESIAGREMAAHPAASWRSRASISR